MLTRLNKSRNALSFAAMTAILILAACAPAAPTPPTLPTLPVIEPTVAPTLPEPRTLAVCLGKEPASLYIYASSSRATWSVLEAIYDGPFDTTQFSAQPIILEKLPNLADGSAVMQVVDVRSGELVVDASGSLVSLARGVKVQPAGCNAPECVREWDGVVPLQMDQLTINYTVLPGLTWSDGQPLTADDSLFSFEVASDPETPVSRYNLDRTASYTSPDERTATWVGIPGFKPQRYDAYFFIPLPRHAYGSMTAAEMLTDPQVNQTPLGWGPYIIEEWTAGDHITLSKNVNYIRAGDGLPKFDHLVYRFLGRQVDNNLAALLAGECDLVDQATLLDEELELMLDLDRDGKAKAYILQGPEWEHVTFGIKPASYDDGYAVAAGDRLDLFSDLRMRQAFSLCMDRQKIVDELLFGQSSVPAAFLPPEHPLLAGDIAPLPFDPAQGSQLLDQVGWKDDDGNPATPRVALEISGIEDGTPLEVNYATSTATLRTRAASILAESMAQCGIKMNIGEYLPEQLYAAGPEGILFGRKFDLAQFGWETGIVQPCSFFDSTQIPNDDNFWLGVNLGGYSNPDYDAACRAANALRPEDPSYVSQHQQVQRIFAQDLPVVPLYFRLNMAVSRVDLCGLELDATARSALWALEDFDFGEGCP